MNTATGLTLTGNNQGDALFGSGNDVLNGGANNDAFAAGAGNDVINGGTGNDAMSGGRAMTPSFSSSATASITSWISPPATPAVT